MMVGSTVAAVVTGAADMAETGGGRVMISLGWAVAGAVVGCGIGADVVPSLLKAADAAAPAAA